MEIKLDGKSTIITGAAGGIGRAAALAFGEAGARLILADRTEAGGEDTAAMVRDAGGTARFVRTDVAVKHELRAMLAAGGGSIVNTSSGLGIVAQEGCVAYCASKSGVLSVTRCAAIEYAKRNIRVNALLPGVINTGLMAGAPQSVMDLVRSKHPIGRYGEPEEVAAAPLWLLSDAASFVTGSSLVIDWGFHGCLKALSERSRCGEVDEILWSIEWRKFKGGTRS